MGVLIKATGVSSASHDSSIDNAVNAGQQCLQKAGISSDQVDLLINVGVYRDDNIMEPSIASLIQQRLQLNPDPVNGDINARTFSFDLMNGACGFLNAVDVAGAMLQSGVYRNVLVVGGDVHPSRRATAGWPFASVGGAVLLAYKPDPAVGFSQVCAQSSTRDEYYGYTSQGAMEDFGDSGRQHAVYREQPHYQEQFTRLLSDAIRNFLQKQSMRGQAIDYLITSQIEPGFPGKLAATLGLSSTTQVIDIHDELGDPHTAAPMICLHKLIEKGVLKPGVSVLFALVGSGITSTCALYRVPA